VRVSPGLPASATLLFFLPGGVPDAVTPRALQLLPLAPCIFFCRPVLSVSDFSFLSPVPPLRLSLQTPPRAPAPPFPVSPGFVGVLSDFQCLVYGTALCASDLVILSLLW